MGRRRRRRGKGRGSKPTVSQKVIGQAVNNINRPASQVIQCHTGIIPVFQVEDITVWGGRAGAITSFDDWDLMILMSDSESRWDSDNRAFAAVEACERARKLFDPALLRPAAPNIHIAWPDFSVPKGLTHDWWQHLVDGIQRLGSANVAVGCTGGHGRTGTVLSILASLMGALAPHECPVQAVREAYCDRCVETPTQGRYITEITGRQVKAPVGWAKQNHAWYAKPHTSPGGKTYEQWLADDDGYTIEPKTAEKIGEELEKEMFPDWEGRTHQAPSSGHV